MINSFQKNFIEIFDKNGDRKIDFSELYPLFLLGAMLVLFFILINNLNILIVFKQSKLFILFFALLIIYSVLYIINYNKMLNSKKKLTIEDNFYYIINILNILLCAFTLIYLSEILFLK
uniref:EF-hand domain-containing protein n=1 Tax=viral metagenome TaxID=1070528 RepID=A0A6C0JKM2_9ZZZZ